MTRRIPHTFVVLLATLTQTGCFSYHRATGDALPVEPLGADAWVRPDARVLTSLLDTPGIIPRYQSDRALLAEEFPDISSEKLDLIEQEFAKHHAIEIIDSRLTDGGLLRLWNDPRNPEGDTEQPRFFSFGGRLEYFVERGTFLTPTQYEWQLAREASRARHGLVDRPAYRATDVRGVTTTDGEERWRLSEGYSLGYSVPEGGAVGLVIHLTSLYENKYEHAVIRRLKQWGWAVAHLETQIGVRGPLAVQAMDRRNEREAVLESRMPLHSPEFSERIHNDDTPSFEEIDDYSRRRFELGKELEKELPNLGTGFELSQDKDPGRIAELIAHAVDLRLSEHADAVAALVTSLDAMRPELIGRPIVVTGFSAGALAAPATAARLRQVYPDRPILLVLAGGGGTVLDIAMGSVLTNGGIRLNAPGDPDPSPEQIVSLRDRYESESHLDPIRVAAILRDMPVLHIYASRDTVVPTAAAERFNAAHGSVDRLVHIGDHDTLLFFLNSQSSRIRSWLRTHGIE